MFSRQLVLTVTFSLLLGACASNSATQSANRGPSVQCPAGKTMVCEVRSTSRITHGSFSKRGTNCACEEEGRTGATIIPDVNQ